MSKRDEGFRSLSASLRSTIRAWLLGEAKLSCGKERPPFWAAVVDGRVNYYTVDEQRQVSPLSRDAIATAALAASIDESYLIGPEVQMTVSQCKDLMAQLEAQIIENGFEYRIDSLIAPIGFCNDEGFCFHRMMIPRFQPRPEDIHTPRNWDHLGPFMNSLRTHMSDYDADSGDSLMFRRLLSAIGALVWDSKPSREIVYWYGEGGDGKSTLCNFIASQLGNAALPNLKPRNLENDYYLAELEGKRFVVAEEAGKGQFLTEGVKALSGNRYVTARAPYKPIRTFLNHTMIWYTSNEMPRIDGGNASLDRLRLICSSPNTAPRRDEESIFAELRDWWPHIVDMGILEFFMADKRIWPMLNEEVCESIASYYFSADGFIAANLIYERGSFMPMATVVDLLNRAHGKISHKDLKTRILTLGGAVTDGPKPEYTRGRVLPGDHAVWGFKNVGMPIGHRDAMTARWRSGVRGRRNNDERVGPESPDDSF